MSVRPLSLLFTLAALPLAAAEPVVEAGVAARVNDAGRDAFFMISEDGDAIVAFLPEGKAGWRREIYVSQGPGIAAFTIADFDGDGGADLAIARQDRRFSLWRGDGANHFDLKFNTRRELPWTPAALRPAANGPRVAPDLVASAPDGRGLLLRNDGFGVFEREEPAAGSPDGVVSRAPQLSLATDGGTVLVRPDGLLIFRGPGDRGNQQIAPFAVRAAASGDFDGDGIADLGLAGYGARPRFAILPGAGGATLQPDMPTAGCSVSVVSLTFSPSSCSVNVGDTVNWSGLAAFHTVTSINAACTDACNGKFCSPASASTYSHTFAAGEGSLYKCNPHCGLGMTGTITVSSPPAAPGTVPDSGTPFRVAKNGTVTTNLDLTWGASCGGAATTSYEVYQGTLPISPTYNHASLNCNLGNVTATTVTPGAGSRYYLIVPRNGSNEGSYGRDSANAQIPPPAAGACLTQNLTGGC